MFIFISSGPFDFMFKLIKKMETKQKPKINLILSNVNLHKISVYRITIFSILRAQYFYINFKIVIIILHYLTFHYSTRNIFYQSAFSAGI